MMNRWKPVVLLTIFGLWAGASGAVSAAASRQDEILLADGMDEINSRGILNGQKGYRYHRPGYRRHTDGWWYPPKAFEEKAPAASPQAEQKAERKAAIAALPAEHVRWCRQNYRSYQAEDNTFQPYEGPRKPCRSPFLKKK